MAPYYRPVTSRCYVSTFRAICDSFIEVISAEVENSLRTVNIHQFLFFPAFQQNMPLMYELLKCWDSTEEGFKIKDHLLKFTTDEVAILTDLTIDQILFNAGFRYGDFLNYLSLKCFLQVWFLEHINVNTPRNPDSRPRFLRWEGNTNIFYSSEKAAHLLATLKEKQILYVLDGVSAEEADLVHADLTSFQPPPSPLK
ncbi:hypothetical protein M5K25_017888 [Dendrobium thyrsiflorum]|uniref:Uncharacterized protein n=1 Tax=Dendrobium thyrsiflorum TaxID=117978 RepID=A0ABD0UH82_DENTH